MITVLAALIIKEGKILIARRNSGNEEVIGKWEFPGGKLEKNETEEVGIEREIREELGIVIKANKYIMNNIFNYPNKSINLKLYECEYISGNINNLTSHSEYKYVKANELLKYDLCPADIELAKYVSEKYSNKI